MLAAKIQNQVHRYFATVPHTLVLFAKPAMSSPRFLAPRNAAKKVAYTVREPKFVLLALLDAIRLRTRPAGKVLRAKRLTFYFLKSLLRARSGATAVCSLSDVLNDRF